MRIYPVKENSIGSDVREILWYKQTDKHPVTLQGLWRWNFQFRLSPQISRDKTMADKFMYIPIDDTQVTPSIDYS